MADLAGLVRDVRLAHWVDHKWSSREGQTAWVSVGGVHQGAASRQMPNPAEPVAGPHITAGLSDNV